MNQPKPLSHVCAFCGRDNEQVARLFAMPNAAVCDECIDSLADILFQARTNTDPSGRFTAAGHVPQELIGEWRRVQTHESEPNVRLRFLEGGLMISTALEKGEPKTMLMRYRVQGSSLVNAELVTTRTEKTAQFDLTAGVLTIDGKTRFERVDE